MTGISDEMIDAAMGVLRAANPWNNLSGESVAAALQAALAAAPTVRDLVLPEGRVEVVWGCRNPEGWVVTDANDCSAFECPNEHRWLIVGPAIEGDDL